MNHNQRSNYFLLFCLITSAVIVYFVIQPFLTPLIVAAMFAFLFQPIYGKLLRFTHGRPSLAAFFTTIVAIILIVLPIAFLGTLILKESTGLYQTLAGENRNNLVVPVERVLDQARSILPISETFELNIGEYVKQGLEVLMEHLGEIFSSFAKMILNVFVFLTAFYFFLKDGGKLKDYLVALSPLDDKDDELIVKRLQSAVSATVKGNLAISLVQGALTGIGFAIFGVPNAVLWGSVTAITALVPGVGTALVIVPAIVFLFLTGNAFGGVGLLVWGLTAVGLVDNFLGPKLVGRGMQLHPLAVFLAVFGGLALFGPLGFLLGPLAVSVCLALIDIYSSLPQNLTEPRRG
ncbi:MAG: AI-2E family transporter [bacterium]|nr:AI-2E family transporter [bacterium]